MEQVDILKRYPWYIPGHVTRWQSDREECIGSSTELVIMNHPESVMEQEVVDIEYLISLVDEQPKRRMPLSDALASLEGMKPKQSSKRNSSKDLIDKFLEIKDLRITPPPEDENEVPDLTWDMADPNQPLTAEDDLASEELAHIYLNQKLYKEASCIYNRLFLLYSEKSVYFASQIENIDKILENNKEK